MVGAGTTSKYLFDLRPGDIYWCTADCGWITGHTYLTYGPMLNGVTQVRNEAGGSTGMFHIGWGGVGKCHKMLASGTLCRQPLTHAPRPAPLLRS